MELLRSLLSQRLSRLSRPRSLCDITNQSRRGLGEIFSPLQISPRSRLTCCSGRIYVFFFILSRLCHSKKKSFSCMYHKAEKSPSHLNHLDSCSRFIFISLCFWVWQCMIVSLKQKKRKFKPRIKLNHNVHGQPYVFFFL